MKSLNQISKLSFLLSDLGMALLQFLMLVLPMIIIASYINTSIPALAGFLLLFSGWFSWTFLEYYNHRFRMHSSNDPSKVIGYERHILHHHHPTDIKITVVQRIILFSVNVLLIILCTYFSSWIFFPTGVYTGFVIYTLMHWFLHRRFSAKLFPEIHRFHIHHHCKHPDKCFGITITWWDYLFDTVPYQQKEITERIKTFYYKK